MFTGEPTECKKFGEVWLEQAKETEDQASLTCRFVLLYVVLLKLSESQVVSYSECLSCLSCMA